MRSKSMPSSTRRLWCLSLLNLILFCGVHLLGFQEHVSVLAGTHTGHLFEWFAGVNYLIISFSLVSIAPILLIGGGIRWLWTLYNNNEHHGLQ